MFLLTICSVFADRDDEPIATRLITSEDQSPTAEIVKPRRRREPGESSYVLSAMRFSRCVAEGHSHHHCKKKFGRRRAPGDSSHVIGACQNLCHMAGHTKHHCKKTCGRRRLVDVRRREPGESSHVLKAFKALATHVIEWCRQAGLDEQGCVSAVQSGGRRLGQADVRRSSQSGTTSLQSESPMPAARLRRGFKFRGTFRGFKTGGHRSSKKSWWSGR